LLIRRAVAAFFLETADGGGEFDRVGQGLRPARLQPAVAAPGADVDRAAILRRDERKTVGGKHPGLDQQRAGSDRLGVCNFSAARPVVTDQHGRVGAGEWGGVRADMHHATERGVAPGGGSAAGDEFDAEQPFARDLGPGDPAAERIIERDTVEQHERTAGPAGSEAAKGNALRGGVGGEAVAPAKQTERGNAAECAVERSGRCDTQILAFENVQRGGDLHRRLGRACGGDDFGSEADDVALRLHEEGRQRERSERAKGGAREQPAEKRQVEERRSSRYVESGRSGARNHYSPERVME